MGGGGGRRWVIFAPRAGRYKVWLTLNVLRAERARDVITCRQASNRAYVDGGTCTSVQPALHSCVLDTRGSVHNTVLRT